MKKQKNYHLQLDYITDNGNEKTKYFCRYSSLLRFAEDTNVFMISIYDFNTHKYIFRCSDRDLLIKKLLIDIKGVI